MSEKLSENCTKIVQKIVPKILSKVVTKVVNGKAVASPAVRRVARELNVNIHEIPGSGKKGRIYKEDVVSFNNAPVVSADTGTPSGTG